MILIDFI